MCWNWQTRRTQNPLVAIPCGFDPRHRHNKKIVVPYCGLFVYIRCMGGEPIRQPRHRHKRKITFGWFFVYHGIARGSKGRAYAVGMQKQFSELFLDRSDALVSNYRLHYRPTTRNLFRHTGINEKSPSGGFFRTNKNRTFWRCGLFFVRFISRGYPRLR